MTRDVLIKISGLQRMNEDDMDPIEVITAGDYFLKNGKHYVLYDEIAEGFEGTVHNTIKISPDTVDIRKSGVVTTHMVFTVGKSEMTHYETPLGEMMIETRTDDICFGEQEDKLQIQIEYALSINYEHVSNCTIHIEISSREKTELHLRAIQVEKFSVQ